MALPRLNLPVRRLLSGLAVLVLFAGPVLAQDDVLTSEKYQRPPEEIARIVLAPRWQNVNLSNLSPDGRFFLIQEGDGLTKIASFARKFYRLGGVQIDPEANRSRTFTLRSSAGFTLFDYRTDQRVAIQVPRDLRVSNPQFSPNGSQFAFYGHTDTATHLYVAECATGRVRQVSRDPVMPTYLTSFEWTADGENIMAAFIPARRGAEPPKPAVPTSPMVRLTKEGNNELRVFPSLLEDAYQMDLLEYHITAQLGLLNVRTRRVTPIGPPDMVQRIDPSPDGAYIRVTHTEKPFSYIVPVSSFGSREEIWDRQGNVLAEIQKRDMNLGDRPAAPTGGGARGGGNERPDARRSVTWRPDGQGLSYLQQEPAPRRQRGQEEEPETPPAGEQPQRKDRLMQWVAPFDSTNVNLIYENENRMASVVYSEDMKIIFATETVSGRQHLFAVFLDDPGTKYTLYRYRTTDFYKNPGSLMTKRGRLGVSVARISSDGRFVYLSGTQYFEDPMKQAPKVFIDKVEIKTGETTRVYESAEDVSERVLEVLDDDLKEIIVSRESPTVIADSWLVDTATKQARKLTANVDYSQEITRAIRKRFQVTRADGFKFWVNITLPPDWREGQRLPALFWFYPSEFTDQKNYDEGTRRYNKNSFPNVGTRTMSIFTVRGYALVEPDCPIVGPAGRMNDNYTGDLRNNLAAVVQAIDRLGYVDTDRLAIGGHSYGAFSTANALIQTPYFKAGIAGDGNYNRLLTPFNFQSERRILWDMREIYLRMSPLLWANEMNGALLMYHGMDDQNVGTDPLHSPKLFAALNGLGKPAALYMYPYEDHGPAAEETLLDLWARWDAWLDKYVKNPAKPEEEKERGRGR
jgi:dipeptidyl aminopeptidase/acylaminoacyl peptidase